MIFYRDYSLKKLSNFRAGGIVSYFTEINDSNQIPYLISFASRQKKKIRIIGNTTNILFSDSYLNEVMFRLNASKVKIVNVYANKVELNVESGMKWDDLVTYTLKNKLYGLELLSGIPGTVGAAPVQNIGAYGAEISNYVKSVYAFDTLVNKCIYLHKDECNFGYRDSVFKQNSNRYIVQSINILLSLKPSNNIKYESLVNSLKDKNINRPTPIEVRNAILEIRKNKFGSLNGIGTAGSFFKNAYISHKTFKNINSKFPDIPHIIENGMVKLYSGWLIEQTGWKGKEVNNVSVSKNNALILQNTNNKARAIEIYEVAQNIKKDVYKMFGVKLQEEVELIGF